MTGPRPVFTAAQAVKRALQLAAARTGEYQLGTGDYRPTTAADDPWTPTPTGVMGSDCAGFAPCWTYGIPRHRPGFNVGPWSSVSDDINCNSANEDAEHGHDLFMLVDDAPQPGDLISWPTIRSHGGMFSGHICIVVGVDRAATFDLSTPDWSLLDVVQVCGGNGRKPAALATDGTYWVEHDRVWPLEQHRSRLLRVVP